MLSVWCYSDDDIAGCDGDTDHDGNSEGNVDSVVMLIVW